MVKIKLDNNKYLLRLEKGDKFVESMKQFIQDSNYDFIAINNCIGMTINNTICQFNLSTGEYVDEQINEELEVISINGNISYDIDNNVITHIHGVFSKFDKSVVGGHIKDVECLITLEIIVECFENTNIKRFKNISEFDEVKLLNKKQKQ